MSKKIKIQPGDIFSIDLDNQEYAFGRVLTKVSIGHCIEIFDFIGQSADDYIKVDKNKWLMPPQIIDSYSLFWLSNQGNWEVKAKQKDFTPSESQLVKFEYGDKTNLTLVDIFGNLEAKNINDDNRYPPYIPKGDAMIKRVVNFWRDKVVNN